MRGIFGLTVVKPFFQFRLSVRRYVVVVWFGVAISGASGCATTPDVMSYYPDGAATDVVRVWPPAPDVPRYRFAGELRGEANFGPAEQSEQGTGERLLRWLVGLGSRFGVRERTLVRPQSGLVDATGRILVTDAGRPGVFVFDESLGKLSIWAQADESSDFESPIGIVEGGDGEILVADSVLARVVKLDVAGNPRGSFGSEVLGRPTGLARDPETGNIFVADTLEHDIKVFSAQGALTARIGRRGDAPGEFNAPTHLAFADGRLYVSDTLNARVQVINADGSPVRIIGRRGLYVGDFTRPKGVTVDRDKNVYVIESYYDHLLVFSQKSEFLLPIGGSGTEVGQFYLPAGVWRDRGNRIFVADMFNARVMIFQYLGA